MKEYFSQFILEDLMNKLRLDKDVDFEMLGHMLEHKLSTVTTSKPGRLMSTDDIKAKYIEALMASEKFNDE